MKCSKTSFIRKLQTNIQSHATKKRKKWFEDYMRNQIKFRGTGIPQIRKELSRLYKECEIDKLSDKEQISYAFDLISQDYSEDKLAGIMILQYYIVPNNPNWKVILNETEKAFKSEHVYDWSTCDWYCVRVLRPLIEMNGEECAKAISSWHTQKNLWLARASVVAFSIIGKKNTSLVQTKRIINSCKTLIKRDERFAKTAVGWILREISTNDEDVVSSFIKKYGKFFSSEAFSNATKYMNKGKKAELKAHL